MPKPYATFAFKRVSASDDRRYESDHTDKYSFGARFVIPPHAISTWAVADSNAAATAMSAVPLTYTDVNGEIQTINDEGNSPCAFGDLVTPRKIRFHFSNGSSTSVAIGQSGTDILIAYGRLKSLFEVGGVTVDCAHLLGERFTNLNDVSGVAFNPSESTAPAGSGPYYSGIMTEYKSEITNTVVPLRFKVMSTAELNGNRTLPPIFSTISACLGNVGRSAFACPRGASTIDTRRVKVLYKADAIKAVFERRELPVTDIGAALKTCLITLAGRPGVACLSYKGEDRKNIHLLYTPDPG